MKYEVRTIQAKLNTNLTFNELEVGKYYRVVSGKNAWLTIKSVAVMTYDRVLVSLADPTSTWSSMPSDIRFDEIEAGEQIIINI